VPGAAAILNECRQKMAALAEYPWATLAATCIVLLKTGSRPEKCHWD